MYTYLSFKVKLRILHRIPFSEVNFNIVLKNQTCYTVHMFYDFMHTSIYIYQGKVQYKKK